MRADPRRALPLLVVAAIVLAVLWLASSGGATAPIGATAPSGGATAPSGGATAPSGGATAPSGGATAPSDAPAPAPSGVVPPTGDVTPSTGVASHPASGDGSGSPPRPIPGLRPTGPTQEATVASVTDGDTIRVVLDGREVPVRYIGIDAPETHAGPEPLGREATDANAELVAGGRVTLEKDVSETDRYGRLLRHVWVETDDGWILVGLELLRMGLAHVVTFPPDVKYIGDLFAPAEREAREAGTGIWAMPGPSGWLPPFPGVRPGGKRAPPYREVGCVGSVVVDAA